MNTAKPVGPRTAPRLAAPTDLGANATKDIAGALNALLQERLNPWREGMPEARGGGRSYRPGDRVLQLRNDYDLGVFNGDLGTVEALDPTEQELLLRLDDGHDPSHATLEVARRQTVARGEFYTLLPPLDDIHFVRTVSRGPSVSIHLLANDTACVTRHRFEPRTGMVVPFRSGYSNAKCLDSPSPSADPS